MAAGAASDDPFRNCSTEYCNCQGHFDSGYVPDVAFRPAARHPDKVWPNAAALMTFNEPNHPEQSRLTPAQAAAAWSDVEKAARVNNISRIGELPS